MAALALAVGALLVTGGSVAEPAGAAGNPIQTENALAGTTSWGPPQQGLTAQNQHALEGYASEISVQPGDTIHLHVSTSPAARYRIQMYRLGWYGGSGGRLLGCIPSCGGDEQGTAYSVPSLDGNGYVDAGWPISDTFTIPSNAVSGYYLAKLVLTNGSLSGSTHNIPVIVSEPSGQRAPALVVAPVNTWQAYNPWGGKSLYDFQSTGGVAAVKVSFNRPFHPGHTPLEYDLDLLRWLEQEGYDIAYTTDVDVHLDPSLLLGRKVVLTAGHDEYWTKEMRDAFEAARDSGVNIAFMGANTAYWQARIEDSGHTLVEYRNAANDPVTDTALDTILFRDLVPSRPECKMMGVAYNGGSLSGIDNFDFPVNASALSHPWFSGTGFTASSVVRQAVGYEWDQIISGCTQPGPLTTFFHYSGSSPADTVAYTAPSGAIVFSTGTLGFVTALDNYTSGIIDTRLQQFMRNVLADMLDTSSSPTPPGSLSPPVVSGSAVQGQTLSATTGSWTNTPTSYAYQWRRCNPSGAACADIGSATTSTYLLQAADVGSTLRVRVTASNAAGPSAPADSAQTTVVAAVPPGVPVNTGLPVVSGTPTQGQTLTATNGTWTNTPTSYAYQWRRCNPSGAACADIGSATTSTYLLQAADVDSTLRLRVTASNAAGPGTAADSGQTALIAAAGTGGSFGATAAGSLSGAPGSGYKFGSAYPLAAAATATTFEFYARGGSTAQSFTPAIYTSTGSAPGTLVATGQTVTVAANQPAGWVSSTLPPTPLPAGSYYLVLISGPADNQASIYYNTATPTDGVYNTNPAGTPTPTFGSPDTEPRKWSYRIQLTGGTPPTPPTNTTPPTISGTTVQGQTLTATNGTWSGNPTSYTHQWRRCNTSGTACTDITTATTPTYTLQAADTGSTLRIRVTATNTAGPSTPTDSTQTTIVTAPPPAVPANTAPPAVTGSAVEGQTLTGSTGTWTNAPTSYAYQWRRCDPAGTACTDIGPATTATYLLQAADIGSTLRLQVIASNAGGPSTPATSAQSAVVTAALPPQVPANTALPAVAGSAVEGQTVSGSTGSWANTPTSYAYQWRRCDTAGTACTDIGSATASSYLLQAADIGSTLRVRVVASNAAGPSAPADSAQTAVVTAAPPLVPVNTALPAVSGTAQVGQILSGSTGSWSNSPTSYTRQWARCDSGGANCADIGGATAATYLLVAADQGSTFRVRVTAANAAGPGAPATSAQTAVVTAVPPPVPVNTALPLVSGTATAGQTLTASTGTWSNGPTSYAYQWRRCNSSGGACANIGSATASTYLLQSADVGATLRVQVTASNGGGPGAPATSAQTAVVAAGSFGATASGSLSGAPGSGYKFGSAYQLAAATTATSFEFYARGGTAAQTFTPAIYASNGTGPTTLIVKGATVTVAANQAAGWVSSTLPSTALAAGTYYLVLISGTADNQASIYYNAGAATDGVYNTNTPGTPTPTFGTPATEPRKWSYRVRTG